MPLEHSIQSKVLDYLNNLKGCVAENVSGGATQKGRPDINCCYKGQCFRIELKTPDHDNKASVGQRINMKKWSRAGAVCFVAYSLDDVKRRIH